jgi:hypothetical protein
MATLIDVFNDMVGNIISAIPSIIGAIIVICLGYAVGIVAGKAVNRLIKKLGIEKGFEQTTTGKAFKSAGIELSGFVGGVMKVFAIIISVIFAIQILNLGGTIGSYLLSIADYLPRLLGGILIIVFGTVLVDFLATFVGKTMMPMFQESKAGIAETLKNVLLIGLVAFVLLLGLDVMLLSGSTIYPLILGFAIMGAGIALTDGLTKSIVEDHKEFKEVAGYAKFVLYSIFLIVGLGAVFATFGGVTNIVANISWAFAVALALMLIPIAYALTKKMAKEVN